MEDEADSDNKNNHAAAPDAVAGLLDLLHDEYNVPDTEKKFHLQVNTKDSRFYILRQIDASCWELLDTGRERAWRLTRLDRQE